MQKTSEHTITDRFRGGHAAAPGATGSSTSDPRGAGRRGERVVGLVALPPGADRRGRAPTGGVAKRRTTWSSSGWENCGEWWRRSLLRDRSAGVRFSLRTHASDATGRLLGGEAHRESLPGPDRSLRHTSAFDRTSAITEMARTLCGHRKGLFTYNHTLRNVVFWTASNHYRAPRENQASTPDFFRPARAASTHGCDATSNGITHWKTRIGCHRNTWPARFFWRLPIITTRIGKSKHLVRLSPATPIGVPRGDRRGTLGRGPDRPGIEARARA
jgi:hypothetical protein